MFSKKNKLLLSLLLLSQPYLVSAEQIKDSNDNKIANRLETELKKDSEVENMSIGYKVFNGNVTLNGSVSNKEERNKVEQIAKEVPGVKSITSAIKIDSGLGKTKPSMVNDEVLAERIQNALNTDSLNANKNLTVTVKEGVAKLAGTLPNFQAVDQALSIALNTTGIKSIENKISVNDKPYSSIHFNVNENKKGVAKKH